MHYAYCRNSGYHCVEVDNTECNYAGCHYTARTYAECRRTECRGTQPLGNWFEWEVSENA